MKLLVITPVYNGAKTIAETIQSVLLQETDLEVIYHIQDGNSNDGTVAIARGILQKTQNKSFLLTNITTEPDAGMYDAIYKAYKKYEHLDIDWMAWINADDRLLPGAFQALCCAAENPEVSWCASVHTMKREGGTVEAYNVPMPREIIAAGLCDGVNWWHLMQEGSFWKMELFKESAEEFRQFQFAGDWFLWFSFARRGYVPYSFSQSTGCFFFLSGQLSDARREDYDREIAEARQRYQKSSDLYSFRDKTLIHAEVSVDPFSRRAKRLHHKVKVRDFTSKIYDVGVGRIEYLGSEYIYPKHDLYGGREPSTILRRHLISSPLETQRESFERGVNNQAMMVRHILSPMTRREIPDLNRMIAGCPSPSANDLSLQWHLIIDDEWKTSEIQLVTDLVNNSNLRDLELHFHGAHLSPAESTYTRWDPGKDPCPPECDLEYGLKSGPNMQFFKSMKILQGYCQDGQDAALLLELDNFPIRLYWIDRINEQLEELPHFFIAGMHYQGITQLSAAMEHHLNGNAIYGLGHPEFYEFIEQWERVLVFCVADKCRGGQNVAYDVAIDWFLDLADAMMEGNQPPELNQKVHQWKKEFLRFKKSFHTLNIILVHLEGPVEQSQKKAFDVESFLAAHPNACLVHSKAAGKVWQQLVARVNQRNQFRHPLNQAIEARNILRAMRISPEA